MKRSAAVALAAALVAVSGCAADESPITDQAGPMTDLADLPDIDQTEEQMLELIERVRTEVERVVSGTDPWTWAGSPGNGGCGRSGTVREGVNRYLRNLYSPKALTDAEWERALPGVRRIVGAEGLDRLWTPQSSKGSHEVRFSSSDGRQLIFGTRDTTLISGATGCRRQAR